MLRGSLQTIQKVRTTVLGKSESMFEILNTNIDRGRIDLKEGSNDGMFQSRPRNETMYEPRPNIKNTHENGDGPKVVTSITSPSKVVHIHLH